MRPLPGAYVCDLRTSPAQSSPRPALRGLSSSQDIIRLCQILVKKRQDSISLMRAQSKIRHGIHTLIYIQKSKDNLTRQQKVKVVNYFSFMQRSLLFRPNPAETVLKVCST